MFFSPKFVRKSLRKFSKNHLLLTLPLNEHFIQCKLLEGHGGSDPCRTTRKRSASFPRRASHPCNVFNWALRAEYTTPR